MTGRIFFMNCFTKQVAGMNTLWSHYVSGKCFLTSSGWNFHDKTLVNKRKKAWQFDLKFYMVQSIQVEGQKTDRNWEMSSLGEDWTNRSEQSSQWTAEFLESLPVCVILSLSSWHFCFSICVTKYTLDMWQSSEMEGKGFWWSFMLHGLLWGEAFFFP